MYCCDRARRQNAPSVFVSDTAELTVRALKMQRRIVLGVGCHKVRMPHRLFFLVLALAVAAAALISLRCIGQARLVVVRSFLR